MEKVVAPLCSHKWGSTLVSQKPFVDWDGFYRESKSEREREKTTDGAVLVCPFLVWAVWLVISLSAAKMGWPSSWQGPRQTLEVVVRLSKEGHSALSFESYLVDLGDRLVDSDLLCGNYLFSNSVYLIIIQRRPPGYLFTVASHPQPSDMNISAET